MIHTRIIIAYLSNKHIDEKLISNVDLINFVYNYENNCVPLSML